MKESTFHTFPSNVNVLSDSRNSSRVCVRVIYEAWKNKNVNNTTTEQYLP